MDSTIILTEQSHCLSCKWVDKCAFCAYLAQKMAELEMEFAAQQVDLEMLFNVYDCPNYKEDLFRCRI